jgi:WS/DGAT/MGAT family acyltransferase
VRHIALPKPGDWRQLCIQTARLHARPLDMRKPLWEAYVIEGLDNVAGVPKGSFALVMKIHHAAIDGVSGAELAAAIHDPMPDAEVVPPAVEWQPERLPTGLELLGNSAIRSAAIPWKFGKLIARSTPALAKVVAGIGTRQLKVPVRVPRTRFNGTVSANRVFDGRSFSLDDVKAIKNSQEGTTVNDVIMCICGGALRKYLEARHELPEDSLVAMAPMSVRPDDKRADGGNLVTAMSIPLRSDIGDPVERLLAVHEETMQAKKLAYTIGPNLTADAAEFLPSTVSGLLARTYANARLADRLPPMFNTVISNVPGANHPLYSMGSRMVSSYGIGPVTHGLGLFQTVFSYNNKITISAIADRDMMPDPAFYSECIQAAFDELLAASVKPAPKKKSKKAPAKKKRKKKAKSAD